MTTRAGKAMQTYEFIVSQDDDILLREVETLSGLGAAWGKVTELADRIDTTGARIRILKANGERMITLGVLGRPSPG